jgi:hypothetical protein
LNISLQRQETRLIVAGAPPELVQALRNMSRFCWFDHQESAERYSDTEFADYVGISTELLDARRDVSRAIANHLLRTGKRSMRRQAESRAVENAQRIWNDPQHQRIRKLVDPPASQKSFGMRADNAGGAGADEAPEEPKAP